MSLDSDVRKRFEMNGEVSSDRDQFLSCSDANVKTSMDYRHCRKSLLFNTHLNAVLYSSCFWVQIGVLPVSTEKEHIFTILQEIMRKFYADKKD